MRSLSGTHLALLPLFLASTVALKQCPASEEPLIVESLTTPGVCNHTTQNGDRVAMHYSGRLLSNGRKFDSSYDRDIPLWFNLGLHEVITGWDEGLMGMCVGDRRKLVISPEKAYGNRPLGPIPACSTLVFEAELIDIWDIPDEDKFPAPSAPPPAPEPTQGEQPPAEAQPQEGDKAEDVEADKSHEEDKGPKDGPKEGNGSGECRLLGPFALIVQSALGLLALLSLVFKRFRERPRRPLKIWAFDASKQVIGTALLHVFNLVMSMLSASGPSTDTLTATSEIISTEIVHSVADAQGRMPNPCSFYLLNLAIDTTIGIPVLVISLKVLHGLFLRTYLASPPESIKSGNYGQPGAVHWTWWLKQCFIYFLGLFIMKLFVFFLFQALPWLAWVGDWALRWTEGNETLQIAFVMFIFPLLMNAIQYYVIDAYIKDHSKSEDEPPAQEYHSVGSEDDDRDGHEEHVVGDEDDEVDDAAEDKKDAAVARLNEEGQGSSSSSAAVSMQGKAKDV